MTLFCTGLVDVELIVESTVMLPPPLPPLTVQEIVLPLMLIPVPAVSLSCLSARALYTALF